MKVIGAKLSGGLYIIKEKAPLLGPTFNPGCIFHSISSLVSIPSEDLVLLWHYYLGHPHFVYLDELFPHLFFNKSPSYLIIPL